MEVRISNLLKETKEIPSLYIKGCVWSIVESRIQKINRRNALVFSFASITSITALLFVSVKTYQDLLSSGILNYFSLLLSDWVTIGSLWKEFSYVILESLPAVSAVLMLSVIFIVMLSIKKSSTSFKQMNYSIK